MKKYYKGDLVHIIDEDFLWINHKKLEHNFGVYFKKTPFFNLIYFNERFILLEDYEFEIINES